MTRPFFSIKADRPLFLIRQSQEAKGPEEKIFETQADGYLLPVDVADPAAVPSFLANQQRFAPGTVAIPVLSYAYEPGVFLPLSERSKELVKDQCIKAARALSQAGYTQAVLSLDEDSFLHKVLSPRYVPGPIEERALLPLSIFQSLVPFFPKLVVALNVEELCPGGMDATDGLYVVQSLRALGLGVLIASGGTEDFLLLKHRRETVKKTVEQEQTWQNPEPWMASALWCQGLPGLAVLAQGFAADPTHAQELAQRLGLFGVVCMLSAQN